MGCELAQGFHFHRALPAEGLAGLLATGKAARTRRRAAA